MSTTVVPLNEQLHLVALNLYPEVVLQEELAPVLQARWITYLELENHSDALRDMNKFTTPTVIISGCTYNYIVQVLTPHFYEKPLGGYYSGQWARLRGHYIREEHVLMELRQDHGFPAEGEA